MTQESGYLANTVDTAKEFCCLICEAKPARWTWSDLHGEAMCVQCGAPYQLLQYGDDDKRLDVPPKLNIKPEWVDTLKAYWDATNAFMGLGTVLLPRQYPECVEGKRKFHKWLERHPEMVPS